MTSSAKMASGMETRVSGSRLTIRNVMIVLEILALLVTGYMSYTKLAGQQMVCLESGLIDCAAVEASAWSTVAGIPTALLGFIAHVAILSILLLETRVAFFRDNGVLLLFGLTLFGSLYHGYLIYVSFAIIGKLCMWCLTAAAIMFVQLVLTGIRLRRSLSAA